MSGKSRSLGSLLVNVGADTRALDSGLKQATASVTEFGNKTSQVTRKSSAGLQKTGRASAGMGAGIAAGMSRLLPALGPIAAAGSMLGVANFSTSAFADSLPNQMRRLRLEQRKMKLRFGPNNKISSAVSWWTSPSNIKEQLSVGIGEQLQAFEARTNSALAKTPFMSNVAQAAPVVDSALKAFLGGMIPGGRGPFESMADVTLGDPNSIYNFVTGVGDAVSNWWGVEP